MRKKLLRVAGAGVMMWIAVLSVREAGAVVVGPGNCNESGFNAALAAADTPSGGTITFNCGTATIPFTFGKTIANAVTIDGGGTITFDGGNASNFFQFFGTSHVTLKRLTLQHGVIGNAHALENFGTLTLDHVRVINNSASETPMANYGTLSVRFSTFSGNAATSGTLGDGGAIANESGTLNVVGSTFSGNTAAHNGGAIYSNLDFSVTNSTFNANVAAAGGAIYQDGSGSSTIEFATVVANTGTLFAGGVYNDGAASSALSIGRSIISGNVNGNCDGVLVSAGYNLWSGTTSCPFSGAGDAGANSTLTPGALANNGGPTQTMLPAAGNPAINHIPNAACQLQYDQRGGGRPFGAGCDSGAVEVGATIDLIFADGFE